jgi:hypothetical protein
MALTVFAIGYKYQEDVFFDFLKGEDSYDLGPTCFLPTRSLAEQIIEDELSTQYGVIEIKIETVGKGIWSWYRESFPDWDDIYNEDEE